MLCFFNLTDNFHHFFLEVARLLELQGRQVAFLNFWPGEIASLRKNGRANSLLDWKTRFLQETAPITGEQLDDWLSVDPRYLAMDPAARPAERQRFREAAAHLLPTFRRLLRQHAIDAVFLWNGYRFPEPVMRTACEEAGVRVLFGENGFFPNTMQIDPEGINAASSLRHRNKEQWAGCVPAAHGPFDEFLRTGGKLPVPGKALPPIQPVETMERLPSLLAPFLTERHLYSKLARKSPFQNAIANRRIARERARRPSTRGTKLPKEYIFVAFQVHDDTQIVIHSPWADSMETALRTVLSARDRVAPDMPIVVKEHPVDVGRYSYDGLPEKQHVVWLWDNPLEEVMKNAAAVVTVNSTVGLEAVVAGKPVVTLGNAIYNVEGIVHHAATPGETAPALKAALHAPVGHAWRHEFLCKLRFEDMLSAHWSRPTDLGTQAAAARISKLLADRNYSNSQ